MKIKKPLIIFFTLLILVALLTAGLALNRKIKNEFYKYTDLFTTALVLIQKQFVKEVSPKELIYGALKGMLSHLDPYSQFLKPDEYKELLTETEGEFGGLGIEIGIRDGLLTIITPLEGTPAWRAGLKPGDRIVKINGELTKGITLEEAVKKLRGKPGTKVKITILREEDNLIKDVEIVREIIKIQDVKNVKILESGIGYIKISEFREKTPQQLDRALSKLKKKGIKGLILDLRNNPGGLLSSAVKVAERFLEKGKVIVTVKERKTNKTYSYKANYKNPLLNIPMVVLVNKGSASGSEIVAAALKDNKRAIILGEKTFGKGCVQSVIPLEDGSAIRLTTAYYYSPKGKVIQDEGVLPDIKVEYKKIEEKKEKAEEVFEKVENKKDIVKEKLLTDYQVIRALDLLKGILIYQ